jgi:phospholipase/carboxylesterase
MTELAFIHRFERGARPASRPLLILHGTGGNEDDLLPLGKMVAPGAPLLSPRGKVLEQGMPRFFRRLAEGVFDEEDARTNSPTSSKRPARSMGPQRLSRSATPMARILRRQ